MAATRRRIEPRELNGAICPIVGSPYGQGAVRVARSEEQEIIMRPTTLIVLCALFLAPGAFAFQDEANPPQDDPSMIAYQTIVGAFNKKMTVFQEKYQAAKTKEEKNKIFEIDYPKAADSIPGMMAIAAKHPKSKGALAALSWVVQNDRKGDQTAKALVIMSNDFATDPGIGKVCLSLTRNRKLAAAQFLKKVIESNKNKDALGQACFALAKWHAGAVKTLKSISGTNTTMAKYVAESAGEETVSYLKEVGGKTLEAEALALFKRVETEFADVPYYRDRKLGTSAQGSIFELTRLSIGQVAPDIKGEDIDGVKFALSDYRGKVVVIDFWGNW